MTKLIASLIILLTCFTSINAEEKYKDWEVSRMDDLIFYKTHGKAVHGHMFGFFTRLNHCDQDTLYITFSTYHKEKDSLNKLEGNDFPIRVSFPEVDGVSKVISPKLVSSYDFALMKIVTLSNLPKGQYFDKVMENLHQIAIEIESPNKYIFDIPSDEWSLNGYIASKIRAKEICEVISNNKPTL